MKKAVCVLAILSLCGWAMAADVVTRPAVHPSAVQAQRIAGVAGAYTYDYTTGITTLGQTQSRAVNVYDNITDGSGSATSNAKTSEIGDDLSMTGGGKLSQLDFSIWNDSANVDSLASLDVTFSFYDRAGDAVGGPPFTTLTLTGVTFSPAVPPGYVVFITATGLDSANVELPIFIVLTQKYANVAPAGITNLGQAIYHPAPQPTMAMGESGDHFFMDAGYWWFGGVPWADFYYAVGVAAKNPAVLWDTGCSHTVYTSTGGEVYLGYISGNLTSLGRPQRWSAIPFISDGTTIGQINFSWFDYAPANNVKYIIWKRTLLNKPTSNADIYSQGILGPYDPVGLLDRRIHLASDTSFHQYTVNIPIPAGNYYMTLYGEDPNDGADHALAWLTGGFLQDPALEQTPDPPSFMWRSTAFPAPGFANYTIPPASGGGYDPGPELPQTGERADLYNPAFQLLSVAAPVGCRGDFNCDGLIDFNDIDPFVAVLSGGPCCDPTNYNCDVNGNGSVGFDDIDPFVALLSSGATCP